MKESKQGLLYAIKSYYSCNVLGENKKHWPKAIECYGRICHKECCSTIESIT